MQKTPFDVVGHYLTERDRHETERERTALVAEHVEVMAVPSIERVASARCVQVTYPLATVGRSD